MYIELEKKTAIALCVVLAFMVGTGTGAMIVTMAALEIFNVFAIISLILAIIGLCVLVKSVLNQV